MRPIRQSGVLNILKLRKLKDRDGWEAQKLNVHKAWENKMEQMLKIPLGNAVSTAAGASCSRLPGGFFCCYPGLFSLKTASQSYMEP